MVGQCETYAIVFVEEDSKEIRHGIAVLWGAQAADNWAQDLVLAWVQEQLHLGSDSKAEIVVSSNPFPSNTRFSQTKREPPLFRTVPVSNITEALLPQINHNLSIFIASIYPIKSLSSTLLTS